MSPRWACDESKRCVRLFLGLLASDERTWGDTSTLSSWVNKLRSLGLSALLFPARRRVEEGHVRFDQGPIVFHSGLADALLGGCLGAEGRYEGAILAAQDQDIRVRLVQVVVELGKLSLLPTFAQVCSFFRS